MTSPNIIERMRKPEPLGRGLGLVSVALGATELAAPAQTGRAIGIDGTSPAPHIVRAFGARELAAGIAVLLRPNRGWPLWLRVAGDALDLAFLGLAMRDVRARRGRLAFAAAAVLGIAALDVVAGLRARARARCW